MGIVGNTYESNIRSLSLYIHRFSIFDVQWLLELGLSISSMIYRISRDSKASKMSMIAGRLLSLKAILGLLPALEVLH